MEKYDTVAPNALGGHNGREADLTLARLMGARLLPIISRCCSSTGRSPGR